MTKFALLIATVFALISGLGAKEATAQTFHFRSGGVHIDVGHGHHGHRHHGRHYGRSRHGRHVHGYRVGHRHWHDTTHLDYHPGEFVPHYDHLHYVPGHYDVHSDGHWDRHF